MVKRKIVMGIVLVLIAVIIYMILKGKEQVAVHTKIVIYYTVNGNQI